MNTHAYKLAALAALLVVSANAEAAERKYRKQSPVMRMQQMQQSNQPVLQFHPVFDCKAQGNPIEFPNDLIVILRGPGPVAAGTKIHWKMANVNSEGTYVLPALSPKQHVYINNANPGGIQAGWPCAVNVVSLP